MTAQAAFDADFARHRGHLFSKNCQSVGHAVDRFSKGGDFAFRFDGQFFFKAAVGDGGDDLDDAAHLRGQVGRHDIDVVGQIFPRAGDAGHEGLAAEVAVGADFARHAGNFGGEGV